MIQNEILLCRFHSLCVVNLLTRRTWNMVFYEITEVNGRDHRVLKTKSHESITGNQIHISPYVLRVHFHNHNHYIII